MDVAKVERVAKAMFVAMNEARKKIDPEFGEIDFDEQTPRAEEGRDIMRLMARAAIKEIG